MEQIRDPDGDPIPSYVERDLRNYLACGILAHGFARARCSGCGLWLRGDAGRTKQRFRFAKALNRAWWLTTRAGW
jgi:hypothetical protein